MSSEVLATATYGMSFCQKQKYHEGMAAQGSLIIYQGKTLTLMFITGLNLSTMKWELGDKT